MEKWKSGIMGLSKKEKILDFIRHYSNFPTFQYSREIDESKRSFF